MVRNSPFRYDRVHRAQWNSLHTLLLLAVFGRSLEFAFLACFALQVANTALSGAFLPLYTALGFNMVVAALVFARLIFRS